MARFLEFRSLAVILLFTAAFSVNAFAQSPLHQREEGGAHKFTIGVGHAYFAEKESEAKNPVVSAYVLNYDYVINRHWSVGTHNDLLIENGKMEGVGEPIHSMVERPVITKLMGLYSPIKDAHLMFGVGDEIKRSQNHLIINLGVDYGINISEGWEIAGELSYDRKIHGADSWIVGLGICRTIRRHHKG